MTDARPLVALLNNVQTPYRVQLHRRIARELHEVRIASLFTHDLPDQPWERGAAPEINPVHFGLGSPVAEQSAPLTIRRAIADWRKGGAILAWLREHDARAVVIGGYNDLTRLRLIRACRRFNIPRFLWGDSNIRGDRATGLRRAIKNPFLRGVVRSCTGVMPCGTLGAEYFARYGATPERTFLLTHNPDYDAIGAITDSQIAAALARFKLDASRRRIVLCARLIPAKRIDLAIDAFSAIAAERPDWDLLIIGDGPLRADLAARTPPALAHRVTWTGFLSDTPTVNALFRGSHLLAVPSAYEPWGIVLNEAAAAGMAVVASDVVGAAADLVRDNINGFTFPSGDARALAGALRRATDQIAPLRAASASVLADWRRRADPVDGLRRALRFSSVIPP